MQSVFLIQILNGVVMKYKYLRTILCAISCIIFVYLTVSLIIVNNSRKVTYNYLSDYQSLINYEKTIRVAADYNYPPFTYYDEEYYPTGHDIELIYAAAREMKCNIDLVMTDRSSAYEGMKDGTFDLLLSVNYSALHLSDGFEFSSPILADNYVFFGRNDDGIKNVDTVPTAELRIAALKNGSELETFLIPMGIEQNCTTYDSVSEAFQSVVNGENDLVISNCTVGKAIIGLYSLPMCEKSDKLHETNYFILYRAEDEELGAHLNEAIEKLRSDGTLSALRNKWIKEYSPGLTFSDYMRDNAYIIISLLLAAFMVLFILVSVIVRSMGEREKALLETDQMTGLRNLSSFYVRVNEMLEHYPREKFLILFYNIDCFKHFNDIHGINAGDRLIRNIGKELKKRSGEKLICAHNSADNFLVCRPVEDFSAKDTYEKFSAILSDAFPGYKFSVRLGYCPIEYGDDPAIMCDRAMLAQRSVKNFERRWAIYSPEMLKETIEDSDVNGGISVSLKKGDFIPYFQPQYDYITGKIIGAEVLMRWKHPKKGFLLPLKFIPAFEKNGLIYELDKYAWRQACKYMQLWKKDGICPPPLSVNVSRCDTYQDDIADTLGALIEEYGLEPGDIHLEITESGSTENSQCLSPAIKELSERGFFIEMDDFGSGYSSLSMLKELPIDLIKLDMSLVRDCDKPGKSGSILISIIQLAQLLGLPVIAEGVETRSQAEFLKSIGCNYMQGFLFSRPVPFEVYDSMIRDS